MVQFVESDDRLTQTIVEGCSHGQMKLNTTSNSNSSNEQAAVGSWVGSGWARHALAAACLPASEAE